MEYDQIDVTTYEELDLFLPGMKVLLGDHEWKVDRTQGMTVYVSREIK